MPWFEKYFFFSFLDFWTKKIQLLSFIMLSTELQLAYWPCPYLKATWGGRILCFTSFDTLGSRQAENIFKSNNVHFPQYWDPTNLKRTEECWYYHTFHTSWLLATPGSISQTASSRISTQHIGVLAVKFHSMWCLFSKSLVIPMLKFRQRRAVTLAGFYDWGQMERG